MCSHSRSYLRSSTLICFSRSLNSSCSSALQQNFLEVFHSQILFLSGTGLLWNLVSIHAATRFMATPPTNRNIIRVVPSGFHFMYRVRSNAFAQRGPEHLDTGHYLWGKYYPPSGITLVNHRGCLATSLVFSSFQLGMPYLLTVEVPIDTV